MAQARLHPLGQGHDLRRDGKLNLLGTLPGEHRGRWAWMLQGPTRSRDLEARPRLHPSTCVLVQGLLSAVQACLSRSEALPSSLPAPRAGAGGLGVASRTLCSITALRLGTALPVWSHAVQSAVGEHSPSGLL